MKRPHRTALIGVGKIGLSYAKDPVMQKHWKYASHAQVLRDNPRIKWALAIDPDKEARRAALEFGAGRALDGSTDEALESIEYAVLATPLKHRMDWLERMPNLKAVLVEKPLGTIPQEAERFVEACDSRGILLQVNYWRRADEVFRYWADGGISSLIGRPQAARFVYGGGFLNNGSHMLDTARMLLGEVQKVAALPTPQQDSPAFLATHSGGAASAFLPLDFKFYRELGWEIWGENGHLEVNRAATSILVSKLADHRSMAGQREIGFDKPATITPTVGTSLYRMHENLLDALEGRAHLWSSGREALRTEKLLDEVLNLQ